MSYIEGVVYDPPERQYPYVVVFFKSNGEILAAHPAESKEVAEETLSRILSDVQDKIGNERSAAG